MKRFTLSAVVILMLNLCVTLSLLRISDPAIGEKLIDAFTPAEPVQLISDLTTPGAVEEIDLSDLQSSTDQIWTPHEDGAYYLYEPESGTFKLAEPSQ